MICLFLGSLPALCVWQSVSDCTQEAPEETASLQLASQAGHRRNGLWKRGIHGGNPELTISLCVGMGGLPSQMLGDCHMSMGMPEKCRLAFGVWETAHSTLHQRSRTKGSAVGWTPLRAMPSRSVVSDSATPWPIAHQAPLSMGFSRQQYWSGCRVLLQGIIPIQGLNPGLPHCRQFLYRLSQQGILKVKVFVAQSCLTLCKSTDCSSPGSSGILHAGDLGSIPRSGRTPGEGNGNPLQYSCLENPMTEETHRLQSMGSPELDMT